MTSSANETPANQSPPAVLSAAQRHDLARQFERAKQLAGKSPPDFAGVHRVLSECCTLDPGNTLFTAALLVFIDVLKELPATMILRPFGFDTLAVMADYYAKDERLGEAAWPSLMIVLVALPAVIWLTRRVSQSRPGDRE